MKTLRLLLYFCLLSFGSLSIHADRLYGLERMERFDLLPLIHEGTRVKQVSGYDRTDGNDDGFNGTYSTLYVDDNSEYVLLDEIGAGCVYRFWMTYDHDSFNGPDEYEQNIIRFYYDNEESPRLEITIDEFFDGEDAPFEFPLVGRWEQSSHGCYCYVPFPYAERLKITLSGKPYFYNITYHRFDHGDDVVSWTGDEDQTSVMEQWENVGEHPYPAADSITNCTDIILNAGETGTVYVAEGSGLIETLRLDPGEVSEDALRNIWLNINFDGGDSEVLISIGDFFGCGYEEKEIVALPVGMKTNDYWYCHFPMPFWESASLSVINSSSNSVNIPLKVITASNSFIRAEAGYFCAQFNESTFVPDDEDYCFIDETGRGHVVGVSLRMHGTGTSGWRGMTFLEGDERAYIDDAGSPAIHGTGNEDYFNAGWYFDQGIFSRPYHGCTHRVYSSSLKENFMQAYRFHLSDTIPFYTSINFGIEHGPKNNEPGTFSSVVYYYKQFEDGFGAGMRMIADFNFGDAWSEGLYEYSTTGSITSNEWSYLAEAHSFADIGYCETNLTFRLPLVENDGVLLRRRIDAGAGAQSAEVYVDGQFVGTWYEPDMNFTNTTYRWMDSEFLINAEFLSENDGVAVSIKSPSAQVSFNISAYAMRCLSEKVDVDSDEIPDDWEIASVGNIELMSHELDYDNDGFTDMDEYIAGTDPVDSTSLLTISLLDNRLRHGTSEGRQYTLEMSSNLISGAWVNVKTYYASGEEVDFLFSTNPVTNVFYRVKCNF
jgi:hypothetical protein